MSFTFVKDGKQVQEIMQCQHCDHIQTRRNFGDDGKCPMCQQCEIEQIDTIEKNQGMSSFQYRKVLNAVQQNCSGVGDAAIEGIEDEYPNGDDFISACKEAYDEQNYETLTCISGVGEATARKIALGMAEMRDWEDGLAESKFSIA